MNLTITKLLANADDHLVFTLHLEQVNAAADAANNDIKAYVYYNSDSVTNNDYMIYLQNGSITTFPSLVAPVVEIITATIDSNTGTVDSSNNFIL